MVKIPGVMEVLGVSGRPKLRGRNVFFVENRKGIEVPIIHNPTRSQLNQITETVKGKGKHETEAVRYIVDGDDVYIAPAYLMTHDDMARALQKGGKLGDDWGFEVDIKDRGQHGERYKTGYVRRDGDKLFDTDGSEPTWLFRTIES